MSLTSLLELGFSKAMNIEGGQKEWMAIFKRWGYASVGLCSSQIICTTESSTDASRIFELSYLRNGQCENTKTSLCLQKEGTKSPIGKRPLRIQGDREISLLSKIGNSRLRILNKQILLLLLTYYPRPNHF